MKNEFVVGQQLGVQDQRHFLVGRRPRGISGPLRPERRRILDEFAALTGLTARRRSRTPESRLRWPAFRRMDVRWRGRRANPAVTERNHYSVRNATIGSTRVARRAGT